MCSNEDVLHKGGQLAPLYYLGYIYSQIQIYLFIQNVYFEISQKKIILSKQINLSNYCSTLLKPHIDTYIIYSILYTENIRAITKYLFFISTQPTWNCILQNALDRDATSYLNLELPVFRHFLAELPLALFYLGQVSKKIIQSLT